jgi:hypothetical protein
MRRAYRDEHGPDAARLPAKDRYDPENLFRVNRNIG